MQIKFTVLFSEQLCHHHSTYELTILALERHPPEVFCNKGVLRNFAKSAEKHLPLCHSLFFNTVAGLRPATLLKKRLW